MSKEKIIDRVQKLLKLSENNNSAKEANAALLMAQRLMMQHQIDADDLTSQESQGEPVREVAYKSRRLEDWRFDLGDVIAKNFRCRCVKYGSDVIFYGFKDDVEVAKHVYGVAMLICEIAAANHTINYIGPRKRRAGTDFKSSFVIGLSHEFREQVQRETQANAKWALVLAFPAEVQKHFSAHLDDVETVKTKSYHRDLNAARAGFRQGQEFGRNNKVQHKLDDPECQCPQCQPDAAGPKLLGPPK